LSINQRMKFPYFLLLLFLFAASSAFGGAIARQCYGCLNPGDIEKISRMEEIGDRVTLQELFERGYLTILQVGERVDVEELDWNRNLRKVRRQGDIAEWYILMQCVSVD
jgi:hypothetical protein